MTGIHGLEPMPPAQGVQMYVEARKGEISQTTEYEHTTRLNRFLEWCEDTGLDNLNDLTARKCHDYMVHRQEQVAPTTLENEMRTFRLAVEIWENLNAVPDGLKTRVRVPSASKDSRSRDVKIEEDHAKAVLSYLEKYEYATLQHAIVALLWNTGCRTGGLRCLDLEDFYPDRYRKPLLEFNHRPQEGTPLKKKQFGEREVYLNESVGEMLSDYIDANRHDVVDDHNRKPLLTTAQGRPFKTTIQRNVYKITRPCVIGQECPHDRDPETCEAMSYNTASKCPDSVSPHSVRKGTVTKLRDEGHTFEEIGNMVDASPETLREHYDTPTQKEQRDRQLNMLDSL